PATPSAPTIQPPQTQPTPLAGPPQPTAERRTPGQRRRAKRRAAQVRHQAEACAKIPALPGQHAHAAGIAVGDASHSAWVAATPDGSDTVRASPAHTAGRRQRVEWLRACGVTTVALEASGVYGPVLFLTLREAGFQVVMTAPRVTRQI